MSFLNPDVIRLIEACHKNAEDLYEAATILEREHHPNVAYHLASLALEELGKVQLLGIKSVRYDEEAPWREIDDHVKKLFWARYGGLRFATVALM